MFDVNYVPARMSVEDLEHGMRSLFESTYSRTEVRSRLRKFKDQQSNGLKSRETFEQKKECQL